MLTCREGLRQYFDLQNRDLKISKSLGTVISQYQVHSTIFIAKYRMEGHVWLLFEATIVKSAFLWQGVLNMTQYWQCCILVFVFPSTFLSHFLTQRKPKCFYMYRQFHYLPASVLPCHLWFPPFITLLLICQWAEGKEWWVCMSQR